MVKREKARIRVPAFESWFPTCETLSKSLYLSEPHFSHLQTGMMLVPTHRELWAVNEVVYIKYLEQWLKHRIRSLYTSHSCYSLPSLGRCICALTEVLSQAHWRPFLPLVLLPFASGLGWGGYRILHSFFLVLQKPLTSRSLPSVFLLFPRSLGKQGQGAAMEMTGTFCSQWRGSSTKSPRFLRWRKPRG